MRITNIIVTHDFAALLSVSQRSIDLNKDGRLVSRYNPDTVQEGLLTFYTGDLKRQFAGSRPIKAGLYCQSSDRRKSHSSMLWCDSNPVLLAWLSPT